MSEKHKNSYDSSVSKKKVRHYFESYLCFVFIEGQGSFRPESVIWGQILDNDSMKLSKMKQHRETKQEKLGIFFRGRST